MVHKGMLVPNLQPRNPPVGHIGVIPIRDVNRTPSAQISFVAMVEPLQSVQVMQIPLNRGVFTVDFKGVQGLVSPGIACGLEQP